MSLLVVTLYLIVSIRLYSPLDGVPNQRYTSFRYCISGGVLPLFLHAVELEGKNSRFM